MNNRQREIVEIIRRSDRSVFVSGFAGTGKTHLLKKAIISLRGDGRYPKVTAFTGLAAQHLRGTTIARLLGLGLARRKKDLGLVSFDRAEKNLKGVTDLIVDEVSMVSGDYLELMDMVMREATGVEKPFGGIRMIFSGDFMQLPPVRTETEAPFEKQWAFEYGPFQECLSFFLKENFRQTDEDESSVLDEFRQGIISPAGRKFLDEAVGKKLQNPVYLYPLRKEVEEINRKNLEDHPGKLHTFHTDVRPIGLAKALMSSVPIGAEVELKEGVPVILLANDPNGRYVNGSQGKIRHIYPHDICVDLNNGDVVWVRPKTWEILNSDGNVMGEVRGLPMQLGWAATIHRAQGMTLDEVMTDVSRCWEPGQAYVALSRTRSLKNISLLTKVASIKADPVALSYVNHLF